jgi:glucose/arabinose dehydrogenase
VIYWTPVIAPGNLTFYNGAMFPQWKGSALIGGMATQTLNRITFDGKGGATPRNAGRVGHRIPRRARSRRRRRVVARRRQSRRPVPRHAKVATMALSFSAARSATSPF